MTDDFDKAVLARIEELRVNDPEAATKLNDAYLRFKQSEALLEEQAKLDRRDEFRSSMWGVKRK